MTHSDVDTQAAGPATPAAAAAEQEAPQQPAHKRTARKRAVPFYSSSVDEAEALIEAAEIDGLDEEIALLRLGLKNCATKHPGEFAVVVKGAEAIVKAVRARYRMNEKNAQALSEAMAKAVKQFQEMVFPQAYRSRVVWGSVLPLDRSRLVEDERVLVGAGIHSRRRAADELGVEDPEGEFRRWLDEQRLLEAGG